MRASEIIKNAMKENRITQTQLRDLMGLNNQSAVSVRINSPNPKIDTLIELLDAMGYELVIQPKKRGRRPDGQEVVTK